MKFRVWWHDEFKDCENDEERDDRAWSVPDSRSFLYPERPGIPCDDVGDAAEQYAEYFHDHRDGYDDTWPIDFVVHDGEKYHLVSVDRDYEPVFTTAAPKPLEVT